MVNYLLPFAGLLKAREEIGSPHFGAIAQKYSTLLQADGCLWEGSGFDPTHRPQLGWVQRACFMYNLISRVLASMPTQDPRQFYQARHGDLFRHLQRYALQKARFVFQVSMIRYCHLQRHNCLLLQTSQIRMLELREAYKVERFVDDLSGAELRKREAFTPTCNIAGLVSGYTGEGSKTVLPAKAMAKIDFRLVPEQDPGDILAKLQAHLATSGYSDIRITTFGKADPVVTPIDDPFVKRIATIAESFAGKRPSITPIAGGTLPFLGELRRYVGVPGLAAPDNPVYWGNGAHAPNEHIRLDDLDRAVRFGCYLFMELGN